MATASIPEQVRAHCAEVAAAARWVRIDPDAETVRSGVQGLDPELHLLDRDPEEVARYILVLDTINFGSGWFPTLRHGSTNAMTERLTAAARRDGGPWPAGELREMTAASVADVLGEDPGHPLMDLYARALRELGAFLGDRAALDVVAAARGSAARLAADLAAGMTMFNDRGLYKRAQITANDLVLAGVAGFDDVDELTVFADNLLSHVLRLDGVLVLDDELAALIDRGELLAPGSEMEHELRACSVHACELLAERRGVPPRVLDNWLWNRGLESPYSEQPAPLCRTVFY